MYDPFRQRRKLPAEQRWPIGQVEEQLTQIQQQLSLRAIADSGAADALGEVAAALDFISQGESVKATGPIYGAIGALQWDDPNDPLLDPLRSLLDHLEGL